MQLKDLTSIDILESNCQKSARKQDRGSALRQIRTMADYFFAVKDFGHELFLNVER